MNGGFPDVQTEEQLLPNGRKKVTDKESDDRKWDQLELKAEIRQETQEADLRGNEETIVDY